MIESIMNIFIGLLRWIFYLYNAGLTPKYVGEITFDVISATHLQIATFYNNIVD